MKKKIIVIALIGIVLLLLVLTISLKNSSWFHGMMVDKILAERYPKNNATLVQRLGWYAQLFGKGDEATEQLEWANTIWNATDSEPEDYQKAAMIIVTDLGINKEKWLSLGNIIKCFGIPSNIEGLFPVIDDDGNLLVIPENFHIYYENKKIKFEFSLSGFVETVMLVTHNGSGATGTSKLYWPHDYTYAKDFPILAGYEYDKMTNKYILKKMRGFIKEAIVKEEFFGNLEVLTQQERDLINIENMRIYMIDGINKDLAKVYFEFSTKDKTVCYSPWFSISDWQRHDNLAIGAAEKITEKAKEEITSPENKSPGEIKKAGNERIQKLFQQYSE